ncbi:MAG: hypothetical protein ACRCYY_04375, partial [Trueperaceae bacterium]
MKNALPITIVLLTLILLGYPLALLFGLPLARRDMGDIRKWQKETLTAQAPLDVSNSSQLSFTSIPDNAVLVQNGQRLETPLTQTEHTIAFETPVDDLVNWGKSLENIATQTYSAYSFGEAIPVVDANRILYASNTLLKEGSSLPIEVPD